MYGYGNSFFLVTNSILAKSNAGTPPVNTVAPAITGTAQEGQTLTSSTGTWTGTPTITYTYQWKRNGSNIGSATNSTYTLVTADVGQSILCTVTATNGVGSANADSNTVTPTSSVDPDAQAFITAAAITDPTQQSAINTLVVDLKGYNIWTKMKALYPFVGGTASQHKWNLKDARDLDAAFRLVFSGGWTHSSTGALPNGTNAYANTYLVPNSQQSVTSGHFSLYSRTSGASLTLYGGNGIRDNSTALGVGLTLRRSVDNLRLAVMWNEAASGFINAGTETDARGFYLGSRTANNSLKFYKNNSTIGTNTNTQSITSLSLNSYYLAVLNEAGGPLVGTYDNKQLAFASIGNGLTDTEAANLYTAVQAFQTTLGRQVGTPIPLTGTLLNDYPDAAVAYSLRKLSTTYTGNAIRVRRSSDNTEQDFGFVNNVLDTASLLTFCGAGNGFVTTWYDQSGNGLNSSMSTAISQPRIVNAGVLDVKNLKPAFRFDGSNDYLTRSALTALNSGNTYSIFSVSANETTETAGDILSTNNGTPSSRLNLFNMTLTTGGVYRIGIIQNTSLVNYGVNMITGDGTANQRQLSFIANGFNIAGWKNGVAGTTNTYTGSYTNNVFTLGALLNVPRYLNGYIQELVIYPSDQTTNRTGIESNINSFYTIY